MDRVTDVQLEHVDVQYRRDAGYRAEQFNVVRYDVEYATALDAQLTNTLCIVAGELLSYETATLTAANQYALTGLYRGLYGTAAVAHASGAPFARLDGAVFEYDLPPQYVGQTLYIKLQSSNVFGGVVAKMAAKPVVWGIHCSSLEPLRPSSKVLVHVGGLLARWVPDFIINCSTRSMPSSVNATVLCL